MMNIREMINSNNDNSTLFVLKGFDLTSWGYRKTGLPDSAPAQVNRLMTLSMEEEKVIAYEEFILLYEMVMGLFKQVIIIENPLYKNLYPIGIELDPVVAQALLAHFDDEADGETVLGDLQGYLEIYSNYIETPVGIACCFNLDPVKLKHEKIRVLKAADLSCMELEICHQDSKYEQFNICTDVDYYVLLHALLHTENTYAVNCNSYIGGAATMLHALAELNGFFNGRIVMNPANSGMNKVRDHIPQIEKLMNQYWGYSDFRKIPMYDVDAVNHGEKKVVAVSQECIISDLVAQVENCRLGKPARDLFVTAPTGSGKSLMFQLPAMYLAQRYGLLTIVITPLIGLMNDQVQALVRRGYHGARTINSDISPVIKNEILEEVASGACDILYLSPESLLGRSDICSLIGSRRIGMLVVDEAHIVTTWGKQFRPDYWYLGDYVNKLRKTQGNAAENPMSFVIATFTATAIYKGKEDMYNETLNSLHMIDPITYLGYIKRENISIDVREIEAVRNRTEYELDKFDSLIKMINTSLICGKKTLIYFPTVALIERFYEYCYSKNLKNYVTKFHGRMSADSKNEAFRDFLSGEKLVMLATKAFGMGIDIPDIANVSHYAPTGNVCDYMQEIGRAARDKDIDGHAIYEHMSNDFKHINSLQGLSRVYHYQLTGVISKILELFVNYRNDGKGSNFMKKSNEMLIDTECFAYLFDGPMSDESTLVNKVKTAMLLIQKDYENRGFSPFRMRPIPIFAYGYLAIQPEVRKALASRYPGRVELVDPERNVCNVNLKSIWETSYQNKMSFPKFKYMLYSGSEELDFNQKYPFSTAMAVDVIFEDQHEAGFDRIFQAVKDTLNETIRQNKFYSDVELIQSLMKYAGISKYKAENIIRVLLAAVNTYAANYSSGINAKLLSTRATGNGTITYKFEAPARNFFFWIQENWKKILKETKDGCMYVTNETNYSRTKEVLTVLGILESFGILTFKSLGGTNSQIYIYVNETKTMRMVSKNPQMYRNRLLESVVERHNESVKMMNFLFQNDFSSEEIWEHLEDYFLGIGA